MIDIYTCPQGQLLTFCGMVIQCRGQPKARKCCAVKVVCDVCLVCDACMRATTVGCTIAIGQDDAVLRAYRVHMKIDEACTAYRRRKSLLEPIFGIFKEQQAARRFLLRGFDNVRDEWSFFATAFNLCTLARLWAAV